MIDLSSSRRSFLAASALLPLSGAGFPASVDPRSTAQGVVKLQADLDLTMTTPWWYEIAIYAVLGEAAPQLILRGEGCETYRMRRDDDGGYTAALATLSLFKDPVDARWLDQWLNPLTNQDQQVRPNALTGARLAFPHDGSVPLPIAPAGASAPRGWMQWLESGDRIGCTMERAATGTYQPLMETGSLWTDRSGFFDLTTTRSEAVFASSYFSPWLGWMGMAGRPGHLLWHSSGRKLRNADELPRGYRVRAEQVAPGFLAAHA